MPNPNKTLIALVLDRSSSMISVEGETREAVNRFIEDQQKIPGEAEFTLVQFDTTYEFT